MSQTFIGAEHMYGICSFGSSIGGQVDELSLKKVESHLVLLSIIKCAGFKNNYIKKFQLFRRTNW